VARGDLTDPEWAIFGPLLPSERGRDCRPALDNRRFLDGMLWIARTGSPWRDLPPEYGKWNSVYRRFRRWSLTGVWDGLIQTLVEFGFSDDKHHMIDSTIVRAHQHAAGVKGGTRAKRRSAGRVAASRPRSTRAPRPRASRSASG
jgi:transposase